MTTKQLKVYANQKENDSLLRLNFFVNSYLGNVIDTTSETQISDVPVQMSVTIARHAMTYDCKKSFVRFISTEDYNDENLLNVIRSLTIEKRNQ